MNRIGVRAPGGVDDLVDAEVALGRGGGADGVCLVSGAYVEARAIDVAVDGDRGDAHLVEGARDSDRYLSAVGDQDFAKHAASLPRSPVRLTMSSANRRRAPLASR